MKLTVVVLCAICALTFANNDSSNQPQEILPVVLPPDGPQLLWHAFQSFIANANPDRPLENLIQAGQNSGNCGSTTTTQTPEVTSQSRQKGKSHAAKKHAKHRSGGKNHKHDKKQAHH
ncbi:uncharacterized protein LOC107397721 [Tribolium castaneum]|uniref:uncharacterized protein LOC107397721 n=1 Tax=Tribolium castaneum TaxID=7070 RepID=UPI00077DE10E|nr:PREDICTED: uncharacterized protein LOC107397721 [Tribolium castaneum]|eukprot:XP_015834359.1 PREDICTED: uncharacterized protein LOC107397721 [Tribolium castaneum]